MKVYSIMESNNEFHRSVNNKYNVKHKKEDTDRLFYEILREYILQPVEENNKRK